MKRTAKTTATRRFWFLVGLLVLGALLRFWRIGFNSLWFDEAFSRDVAAYSNVGAIIRNETLGDLHPPVHFLLLHLWIHVVGDSEVTLRALSALASLLAVPACYHIGRLLFNERTGLIALSLAALSPLQIYYAQEARNYALSITLTAFALWGLIAMLKGKRYGWAMVVAASVANLYTLYFGALPLLVAHFWLFTTFRRQWRTWLSADLVIGVLFLPQFFQLLSQSQIVLGNFWISRPNPAAPITTLTFLLFGMTLPPGVDFVAVVVLMCALALITFDMLRKASRQVRRNWLFCIGTVVVAMVGVLLFSLLRGSVYLDKSFTPLSPLLLIALAAGAAYARRPSPAPLLVGALGVFMVIGVLNHAITPDPAKPPFRQVAAKLAAQPDRASVPILYLHDSATLPIGYYAPSLNAVSRVVDLGDKSWLWPQSALFPQTWQIFGFTRYSRQEIARWLPEYHGKVRVVVTTNLEPPEQQMLSDLLRRPCPSQKIADGGFVTVYDVDCR